MVKGMEQGLREQATRTKAPGITRREPGSCKTANPLGLCKSLFSRPAQGQRTLSAVAVLGGTGFVKNHTQDKNAELTKFAPIFAPFAPLRAD